jgi:serine/threonine protein kinase
LKSDNILIDENGTPKLADFGITKSYKYTTMLPIYTGPTGGTGAYMAPEVFARMNQVKGVWVGVKSDIYSFGIVIWEIAVLEKAPQRTVNQISNGEFPGAMPIRGQMSFFTPKISKCTKKFSSDRPTATELKRFFS